MKWLAMIALALCTALVYAQAPASWGVKTGFNLSQHYGTKGDEGDYEVHTGLRPGFIGGAFLDYEVNENLSLELEALYSMKGSREKIGIKKGSGKPHTDKVGKITRAQLAEIAELKKDQLNAIDEEGRIKTLAGSARSMGVEVVE